MAAIQRDRALSDNMRSMIAKKYCDSWGSIEVAGRKPCSAVAWEPGA
jgi:hypothetical protein